MGEVTSSILVVGAGVVGLSVANRLQEEGFAVTIWSADLPSKTTSANSGAIWGPFLSAVDDRVLTWSFETRDVLERLASEPSSGVKVVSGVLAGKVREKTPEWVAVLEGSTQCPPDELPPEYVCGWKYQAPIIDMPVYLEYLLSRFKGMGGKFVLRHVSALDEIVGRADVVVLCAGLGMRELVDDSELRGSKGQLLIVSNPGLTRFFGERGDDVELTYILPQGNQVILGGTAEWEFDSDDADDKFLTRILLRSRAVEPRLATARVLAHRVGVRPCRSSVRLEEGVVRPNQRVVFNYGHGGSGVSLSWGCANTVLRMLR